MFGCLCGSCVCVFVYLPSSRQFVCVCVVGFVGMRQEVRTYSGRSPQVLEKTILARMRAMPVHFHSRENCFLSCMGIFTRVGNLLGKNEPTKK